jgi:hypothetical protein
MGNRGVFVLIAGLLVGAGEPRGDIGKVRLRFRGTHWVLVRGCKGAAPISKGHVTFTEDNQVEIQWEVSTESGFFRETFTRDYRLQPVSNLPIISNRDQSAFFHGEPTDGVCRMRGRCLELEMPCSSFSEHLLEPMGDLHLILEPEK